MGLSVQSTCFGAALTLLMVLSACESSSTPRSEPSGNATPEAVVISEQQRRLIRCPEEEVLPLDAGDGVVSIEDVVAANFCVQTVDGERKPGRLLLGSAAQALAQTVNTDASAEEGCTLNREPRYFTVVFLVGATATEVISGGAGNDPTVSCGWSVVNNTERANGSLIDAAASRLWADSRS